jgi:hypothetical protein
MMLISPILGRPTIDKIVLKSIDYRMAVNNKFNQRPEIDSFGQLRRIKYFYNSEICNMTVEPDKQGKDCLKVIYNPNNVEQEQVLNECRQVGIDFPILESQVIRADFERHQQLSHSLYSYHSILEQAKSGRNLRTTNNQTFRVGTGTIQIEIYDKSIQAKLKEPNIVRVESRYKKPNYLQKQGIYTLESLLNADTSKLMQLYIRPKDMYLSNLTKLQGNKEIEQVGNYIKFFEQLHQTSSRPTTDFLQSICLNTLGINQILNIIQSADIPKRKRYNAKQYILKQIPKLNIPHQADMVKEILSYFNLAS